MYSEAVDRTRPQQAFRYRDFKIDKSQSLGHGAYGAVYKAKCDLLPAAAKILHPTILDPSDPGLERIMQRFYQECALLEGIRHPNIVQYLGLAVDPESRLPVLLMELLDESLTKLLQRSQRSLPYYVQVDICHDIALAVAYLHWNDIIHRDLSSNNVLIIAGRRAKVTDFGMSKLAGTAPTMTPLTMCPGTVAYMPPEALEEPPRYTNKLDCFSEGVIMIQVCTRLWPEPGPRTKAVPFPASPTGMIQMPVLEPERRKNHIDMIDCSHPLLPIAVDCLSYQEKERPSSEELCQRLDGLKQNAQYGESVRQEQNDISELERQIEEITNGREAANVYQLQEEIIQLQEQVHELKQQLEEQKQVTVEITDKRTTYSLEDQTQTEQQSSPHSIQPSSEMMPIHKLIKKCIASSISDISEAVSSAVPAAAASIGQSSTVKGKWQEGEKVPRKMARGAAVVSGNRAYFMTCGGETYSYSYFTRTWSELPRYPCWDSSLAVVNGLLTAIGGRGPRNKLFSLITRLVESSRAKPVKQRRCDKSKDSPPSTDRKWVEHYPPMPTKRSHTTAITTQDHLIVAGGVSRANRLNTVEVMNTQTLVWSTAAKLPQPGYSATATICGDRLYILGGFGEYKHTKSVLTCSLTKLLLTCSVKPLDSVWTFVSDAPVYHSTCAAVDGELIAVGGEDENGKTTTAIHEYNPTTDMWNFVMDMPTARKLCLVIVLPPNEVIVVGGDVGAMMYTDKVEIVHL